MHWPQIFCHLKWSSNNLRNSNLSHSISSAKFYKIIIKKSYRIIFSLKYSLWLKFLLNKDTLKVTTEKNSSIQKYVKKAKASFWKLYVSKTWINIMYITSIWINIMYICNYSGWHFIMPAYYQFKNYVLFCLGFVCLFSRKNFCHNLHVTNLI